MALFGLSKNEVLIRLRSAKDCFQQFQDSQNLPCETQDLAVELRRLELALRDMELLMLRTGQDPTCHHRDRKLGTASILQNRPAKRASCYLEKSSGPIPWSPLSDKLTLGEAETSESGIKWN